MARHFSREEIEEIRHALSATSVKDTSFQKTDAVRDEDLVPIIQEGINKTAGIKIISANVEEKVLSHVEEAMKGTVKGIKIRSGSSETDVVLDAEGKAVIGLGKALSYDGKDINLIWGNYEK